MDAIHIDSCEFYIKIIFKAARGAVVRLLQALESLKNLVVETSNVGIHGENFILSLTGRVSIALVHL